MQRAKSARKIETITARRSWSTAAHMLLACVLGAMVLVAGAKTAAADEFSSAMDQPLEESSHQVSVRFEQGAVHYTVQRTFINHGDTEDGLTVDIALPINAAVTGMRVHDGQRWLAADLVEASRAGELYAAASPQSAADFPQRPPALMSWMFTSSVSLQLYPLQPGVPRRVEYTLQAPFAYGDGVYHASYPRHDAQEPFFSPVSLRLAAPTTNARFQIEGTEVAMGQTMAPGPYIEAKDPDGLYFERDEFLCLTTTAPSIDTITGRLGRADPGGGAEQLSLLQLEVAQKLSQIPVAPQVVFVLDRSWSLDEGLPPAQLATVRDFLSHMPDATFEIIAARRTAEPVFGRFVPAAEADTLIAKAQQSGALDLSNGSAVDEGMAMAAGLLAKQTTPGYIVAMSDHLWRPNWDHRALGRALTGIRDNVVAHTVEHLHPEGFVELENVEGDALTKMVASTGGMFFSFAGALNEDKAMRRQVLLEMVRPTFIRNVSASAHWSDLPETLDEGAGIDFYQTLKEAPRRITITGYLWSRPIALELWTSPQMDRRAAARVFTEDEYYELDETQQMTLARKAHMISPVTSFLALSPGDRPERFAGMGLGMSGVGCSFCCRMGGGGKGMVRPSPKIDFSQAVASCTERHGKGSVSLNVDTTYDEVVDITGTDAAPALRQCLEEAIWAMRLAPKHRQLSRNTHHLNVR